MKHLIAFVASLLVNVALLGALVWTTYLNVTPEGYVQVTELGVTPPVVLYAQAGSERASF